MVCCAAMDRSLPSFSVGPITASPGTTVSGALDVPAGPSDAGTTIPITVIHGTAPGPVLALVAGIHGMEYVPILTLQRLPASLDPATMRGTVILVHVANMPSFLGRTIYYSPVDGKNLNRVFPGRSDGTVSDRIAGVLTRDVVSQSTHLVDLHGGDGNESLRPYAYWITSGAPPVADASRALALAFGLGRIVVDRDRPVDPAASIYLSNTAITRGIPAITTEVGGLGRADDASIAIATRGIAGVLRHLGLRPDGPAPIASPGWVVKDVVLRAHATGLFHAEIECGATVSTGARIGTLTDFHGRTQEDVRAPFGGEILYVVRTPPITTGEPLAMVGVISSDPE
jgi:predicted deacylase